MQKRSVVTDEGGLNLGTADVNGESVTAFDGHSDQPMGCFGCGCAREGSRSIAHAQSDTLI